MKGKEFKKTLKDMIEKKLWSGNTWLPNYCGGEEMQKTSAVENRRRVMEKSCRQEKEVVIIEKFSDIEPMRNFTISLCRIDGDFDYLRISSTLFQDGEALLNTQKDVKFLCEVLHKNFPEYFKR